MNASSLVRSVLVLSLVSVAGSGCGSQSSEVLPAVFGLGESDTQRYRIGEVPRPVVEPSDRVIGQAAAQPGECIWQRGGTGVRFRAECSDGFAL